MKIKKSIKLNAILNTIKTSLSIIFPLITFPYASRVLQVENLGKINYTASIITYFTLLSGLGIVTYAIRQGAKIRDDKDKFSKFANEIFSINIITTIISYILLFLTITFVDKFHQYTFLQLHH